MSAMDQFRAAIVEAGLTPPASIKADGKLHRFSSNGKRGDLAGWYIFHTGDIPAGAFGCWRQGISETWRADIGRKLTPEELAALKKRAAEDRRKQNEEKRKLQAAARKLAATIWDRAVPAPPDHPYLTRKGIAPHGLRMDGGELVVPAYDAAGVLHSIQTIRADGEKRFLKDGRVSGCHFILGEPNGLLVLCEGFATGASILESTGHAAVIGFSGGNLPKVAKELRTKFIGLGFIIAADDDAGVPDNPGLKYARETAAFLGVPVAIPDFGENRPEGMSDFNDLCRHAGPEAVAACIEKAAPVETKTAKQPADDEIDIDAEIARLAKLRPVDYERERKDAAAKLNIRAAILDKLVAAERPVDDSKGNGRALTFPDPDQWPEPVNGADLLVHISAAIRKYVVLAQADADAIALWILHTYSTAAFLITPRLAIVSPVKRCGKTTLMDILRPLVWRPLKTASISPAAVFRTVEIAKPTLLIDEADAVFGRDGQPGQNEELRAILNSGHRQGDDVLRVEGDNHEVRMFATFAPVAIALIGKLPETLADRSITVSLKRRLPSETISGFRADRIDDLKSLARKAARWAEDNAGALMHSDPKIPDTVFNREADNWRPLFVIAAVAGGDWPRRVRKAALGPASAAEDEAYGIQLLTDIRDIFAERGLGDNDGMPSADLVAALIALPERSWGECNRGKAITQSGLAKRLSPFGIRTRDVHTGYGREGTRSFKGYAFKTLKEVFARYIPGFSTAQPRNGNLNNDLDGKSNRATANGCADGNSPNSLDLNELLGCADENGETGEREDIGAGDDCACAQCHGPIDGTEELVLGPDGEGVWLHPQCKRFYFGGRTAR